MEYVGLGYWFTWSCINKEKLKKEFPPKLKLMNDLKNSIISRNIDK